MIKHLCISFVLALILGSGFAGAQEGVDIQDKGPGYEVRIDIAGAEKENLNVNIDQQAITVSGERSEETSESAPGAYYSVKSYGSFSRTAPLPPDADPSKVSSEINGDTLIVRIQKKGK